MKVKDLDKFMLEQVFRPYYNILQTVDIKRLERLTSKYNSDTVMDLFGQNPLWERLVMNRLKSIGFTFDKYLVHPIVLHLNNWTLKEGK